MGRISETESQRVESFSQESLQTPRCWIMVQSVISRERELELGCESFQMMVRISGGRVRRVGLLCVAVLYVSVSVASRCRREVKVQSEAYRSIALAEAGVDAMLCEPVMAVLDCSGRRP